ncbi:hypothetical protein LVJ94_05770 [Pendulispora rubella]|uniref:Acyloxyacyl hydrolase n=1 Tax=Pendulispora rubella TaxID=2741070 RepID=A0ABZ2L751_9BACT
MCTTAAMFAVLTVTSTAHSDPTAFGRGFDLGRFVERGVQFAYEATRDHGKGTPNAHTKPPLGWALVARDWNGGFPLIGELAVATDKVRLTKSTRALLGRVHTGDGPVAAFLHFGIGEWRYDPDMFPFSTRRRELALQFGGGIAVLITKHVAFAWEVNHLTLCRDPSEPQIVPTPYIYGTLGVVDIQF